MNTCSSCRYYLPTNETFYNKPCGYCGNCHVGRRRISDDKACKLYEQAARQRKADKR